MHPEMEVEMDKRKRIIIGGIGLFLLMLGVHFPCAEALAQSSLKAEPPAADLAPPALAAVKLIGAGFKAEDRVLIVLAAADKGQDVPLASTEADASGAFETKMEMLSILQGILHLRFKEGKPVPDPGNPPLPPGSYTLKASSRDSGLEARCSFEMKAPSK